MSGKIFSNLDSFWKKRKMEALKEIYLKKPLDELIQIYSVEFNENEFKEDVKKEKLATDLINLFEKIIKRSGYTVGELSLIYMRVNGDKATKLNTIYELTHLDEYIMEYVLIKNKCIYLKLS